MNRDFDVIIVGAGGAGLAAGMMARQSGASVMAIEADTKIGGATRISSAVFYGCGTSVQKSRGIDDTPNAMFHYMMTLAGWSAYPRIVRTLCDHSAAAFDWLVSLGVQFPEAQLLCSGVDDVPRGHPSIGLFDSLYNAAGASGIEYAMGTRVDRLLVEDGRVVGISADGTELRAGAVIITTGGFGNNPDMLKTHFPTAAQHGDWTYAVHANAPFILGDGIKLGQEVGAAIVGHDTGLLLPTSGLGKWIEAFLPPWIMLVNTRGQRFMDEYAPYAVSGYLMNEQPDMRTFAIFDEVALEVGSQDLRFADPYKNGEAMPTWEYNLLRQSIADGKIVKADTIEELAEKIGVNPVTLAATVAKYNEDCDKGYDSLYFKDLDPPFPVRTGPFYAREARACVIGTTGAGLNVNENAQVLDENGSIIPGLYAAGEVMGCAVGKRYSGGGVGILNAMVFGRIAGVAAAREAASVSG